MGKRRKRINGWKFGHSHHILGQWYTSQQSPDYCGQRRWTLGKVHLCCVQQWQRNAGKFCHRKRRERSVKIVIHVTNRYYYSFQIFPQFWLANSTRIILHNQLLMTKFGRILCLTRKWRQKCSLLQVNAPLTEKTWGQGVFFGCELEKWRTFYLFQE